jgi:predicted nucleic acid-binding protein
VEWIDELHETGVGLDTAPLAYFIEEHTIGFSRVQSFFQALDQGLFRAVASTVSLTEILVHPFRRSQWNLAEPYHQVLLRARNLTVLPVTVAIAERAAELRAAHPLRTPDAMQLATALEGAVHSFLTNDQALSLPGLCA